MDNIRFGSAGVPIGSSSASTVDGVLYCKKIKLDAMEVEFVQGVRMKEEQAAEVKKAAEGVISLSSHAPYFVNLCSSDKFKIANSKRNIFEAARATMWCGGRITVFHPGFYQKRSPEDAYLSAKTQLAELEEKLVQSSIKGVVLGAETVGKKSAFGGLHEVIRLSRELPFVQPVLDFAHIHARGDFVIKTEDDYGQIFALLEKELGDYVNHFHSHFSEINYGAKGERNHMPLGSNSTPPFKPLMKLLGENGYSGTIICETPKLEIDALTMQKEYLKYKKE